MRLRLQVPAADTRRFIAGCLAGCQNGTPLVWVLTDRDADAPIGTIEAWPAHWSAGASTIGCWTTNVVPSRVRPHDA
jgi:hypothetical protein